MSNSQSVETTETKQPVRDGIRFLFRSDHPDARYRLVESEYGPYWIEKKTLRWDRKYSSWRVVHRGGKPTRYFLRKCIACDCEYFGPQIRGTCGALHSNGAHA